jgi:phage tail-like protein
MPRITEPRPGHRFYVEIGGVNQAVFSEASGLSVEVVLEDVEEGGHNEFVHRLPGRCKVGNLTLKRGLTHSNDFLKWSLQVAAGTVERKNVSVVLYRTDGKEELRWELLEAFPVKWSGPQFKADDNAAAIETVEFTHRGLKLG